jgi:hypothetical protein
MAYDTELKKNIYLHQLLMGTHINKVANQVVDHINHQKSDNRRKNLRLVSYKANSQNCALSIRNKSGCTGVSYCASRDRYYSSIRVDGKLIMLGVFKKEDLESAIAVRKAAEIKYFH